VKKIRGDDPIVASIDLILVLILVLILILRINIRTTTTTKAARATTTIRGLRITANHMSLADALAVPRHFQGSNALTEFIVQ